jgi:hypothetical protein
MRYEAPQAQVRGVFLLENVAVGCQSPVRKAEVADWEAGDAQAATDGDISLPLW